MAEGFGLPTLRNLDDLSHAVRNTFGSEVLPPNLTPSYTAQAQTSQSAMSEVTSRHLDREVILYDSSIHSLDDRERTKRIRELRNRISDRILETAIKQNATTDERRAVGNWITTYARARSLERIISRNRDVDEGVIGALSLEGVNPDVTNLAVLKAREMNNVLFPTPANFSNLERNVYVHIARLFLNNDGSFAAVDIEDEIFDEGLIEATEFFDFQELMGEYNIDPADPNVAPPGTARRVFVNSGSTRDSDVGSVSHRHSRGEQRGARGQYGPPADGKLMASQKAIANYNQVLDKLAILVGRVNLAKGNLEKDSLVQEFRDSRDAFRAAYGQLEVNPMTDTRSEDQRVEDYNKTSKIINHSILTLLGQQETEQDGSVDLKVTMFGKTRYIQKMLPENFDFLPPLKENSSSVLMAKKAGNLPRIVFSCTSFENWASEFRDNVGRIPNEVLNIAKKLEHLKDKCLSKEALVEFSGGLDAGINSVVDYYDGLQRLHRKYGRKSEAYPELIHSLHAMTFDDKNANEFKKNLTRLTHIVHELNAISPMNDPNLNARMVFEHMKRNVPSSLWTETQASLQNHLPQALSRGEYQLLVEYAISHLREMVSRASYKPVGGAYVQRNPPLNKPKNLPTPKQDWAKGKPGDPNAILAEQERRKKRNLEQGKAGYNPNRKAKLRAFMEQVFADSEEESEEEMPQEGDELTNLVARFSGEQDENLDEDEEEEEDQDDESQTGNEAEVRKFDQRNSRGNSRNYEPKKPQPPKKPGYGFIDNVETLIADLEVTKKPPCFLDGKNHALVDCPLQSFERQAIFHTKNICQRCLKTGHIYVNCPYKKNLKAYCDSCQKLGHWNFCCFMTLDGKNAPLSGETSKPKSDPKSKPDQKNKKFTPSKQRDVIAAMIAMMTSGNAPQIPGRNNVTK